MLRLDCTDPVSKTSLEYRSILLRPFLSYSSVIGTQLKQVAEERDTRDLREILDLRSVRRVKISNNEED